LKVTKDGMDFLSDVEGLKLVAYLDTGGVPTIGIGSTRMFGKPVKMGLTCTVADAYHQCAMDIEESERIIHKLVKVPLNQNQFNALASFVYNVGEPQFTTSTLLKKLNAGNYTGAADQFLRWTFDNGKHVEGLKNRRVKERALFLKG